MVPSSAAIAATLLAVLLGHTNAGLYTKNSPVLQIDGKSYERMIAKSNYTSIVEFYAPWCGHCKNLQPAYEKAAKSLSGLAKVAAIDCDEDKNKGFCSTMGVQGFPTLKIVKPGKKPGRPLVEDYQGSRTAKGITEAVLDKMPNLVKRVQDSDLEAFLAEGKGSPKALLFTDKGRTSPLLKAIAIDFKGSISLGQIKNGQEASVELFGINKFPTLLLLPAGDNNEVQVYEGAMNKAEISDFLSQVAEPNPDASPPNRKNLKKEKSKHQTSKATPKEEDEVEKAHESAQQEPIATKEDQEESVTIPDSLPVIETDSEVEEYCLGLKTSTCILALIPTEQDPHATTVLESLAEIAHNYKIHQRTIFPFYALPAGIEAYDRLKKVLSLTGTTEIVAVNGRRRWWRHISLSEYESVDGKEAILETLANWIDSIRLGDGSKKTLPASILPNDEDTEELAAKTDEESRVAETRDEPTADDYDGENQETLESVKHEEL